MKGPIRISRGTLSYTGHVARDGFIAWAESPEGSPIVVRHASGLRLAPFGRRRTARSRLWRSIINAANDPRIMAVVQSELDSFVPYLLALVYAPDLPRLTVDLRRLVVIPRLMLNGEMYRRLDRALQTEPLFGVDHEGTALRDWFILMIIRELEGAIAATRPSPSRAIAVGAEWICVGINDAFEWRPPFEGHAWRGHYHLLEVRPSAITRAVRTAAARAITTLDHALESLSALHRTMILRTAADTLARIQAGRRTGT